MIHKSPMYIEGSDQIVRMQELTLVFAALVTHITTIYSSRIFWFLSHIK